MSSHHYSKSIEQEINGDDIETYHYIRVRVTNDNETSVQVGHEYDSSNNNYEYCYSINDLNDFDGTIKSLENVTFDKECSSENEDININIPESVTIGTIFIPTCSKTKFIDTSEHPEYVCFQAKITDSSGNTDNVGGICVFDDDYYMFETGSSSDNTYKYLEIEVNRDPNPTNHTNTEIVYSYTQDGTEYYFWNSDTRLTHITDVDNVTFTLSNRDDETINITFNIYKVDAECPYSSSSTTSTSLTTTPSESESTATITDECNNYITNNIWKDRDDHSCGTYVKNNWCTAEGEEGDGWSKEFGSFEVYEVDGLSAKDACCGCGASDPCSVTDWTDSEGYSCYKYYRVLLDLKSFNFNCFS